ncbi:hypothetical protein EZS27_009650 [termite gut metagenome]|uniref:Winged helix DNA-binding domain-containing protein n=1 Tax=termite gut metagenome TaxID=433724 RepID=A0A5J4S935_9ZZZZ
MDKIPHIRLISQQLSGRGMQKPKDVVSWMGAMQAQDYVMAKWAVGIRFSGGTDKMVEEAFNKGEILRTHVLRPTWHLVAPENIRWMLSLSANRIKSSARSRDRGLGITEELYNQVNRIIQRSLEGNKSLTREAVGKALEEAGIAVDTSRMIHFMMRAEVEGIVCSGVLQGKSHTYALLDERVPPTKPLHKEEALAKLAQLYFTSHCPVTLQDFVWWSGLLQTEAKKGLESVKSGFVAEEINSQTYWIADTFKNVPRADTSIYLLPAFDEYIISYRDRKAVLPLENHSKAAISSNGIFRPTIVANGQVIGLWKKSDAKNKSVMLAFFEQANVHTQNEIDKAIDTFSAFLER